MEEVSGQESSLYVVFTAGGQRYGVPHDLVLEMVQPPAVIPLPGSGIGVMGLINLRGSVLGLVDFRVALGLPSAEQETRGLLDELKQREQEHREWLSELEASVIGKRENTLISDPHACAFGRWFDGFQTENVVLRQLVLSFDAPHKAIHALAHTVTRMVRDGDQEGALDLITTTRETELATMVELFEQTRLTIRSLRREIAIVVPGEGAALAILVDSVDSIESLSLCDEAELGQQQSHPLLTGVATDDSDELILLVNARAVFNVFSKAA